MNKDIAFVANCGRNNRVIARIKKTYFSGSFKGSYKELIEHINENYDGQERLEYIEKVNLLKNSCFYDFKDFAENSGDCVVLAVMYSKLDVLEFLHQNGADITHNYNEAVSIAARIGNLDIIKYLHQNGADITDCNNDAVYLANRYGHYEVIEYLLANGAKLNHTKQFRK